MVRRLQALPVKQQARGRLAHESQSDFCAAANMNRLCVHALHRQALATSNVCRGASQVEASPRHQARPCHSSCPTTRVAASIHALTKALNIPTLNIWRTCLGDTRTAEDYLRFATSSSFQGTVQSHRIRFDQLTSRASWPIFFWQLERQRSRGC